MPCKLVMLHLIQISFYWNDFYWNKKQCILNEQHNCVWYTFVQNFNGRERYILIKLQNNYRKSIAGVTYQHHCHFHHSLQLSLENVKRSNSGHNKDRIHVINQTTQTSANHNNTSANHNNTSYMFCTVAMTFCIIIILAKMCSKIICSI